MKIVLSFVALLVLLSLADYASATSDCKLNGTWGTTTFSPRGNNFADQGYLIVHDNGTLEVGFTLSQSYNNGSTFELCSVSSLATFSIVNDTNTLPNTTVISVSSATCTNSGGSYGCMCAPTPYTVNVVFSSSCHHLSVDFPLYSNPVTMKHHAPVWSQVLAAVGIPIFVIVVLAVGFWRWRSRNTYEEV
eukprot:TRINITY_DN829_c0_g5_i1.p1 TRINITY_DN829_c0_g5~~TRINITY_DN829_c0_g5_i1.p1  ORF type:complete len:190 (-),score=22.93 TRINITY_DN829_c0_g5_i1:106-675(-)